MVGALLLALAAQSTPAPYEIRTIELPDDVVLEVGGIEHLPDGRILVCTRRGQVWIVDETAGGDVAACTLFADGLQEPLGLLAHDGWIYCAQRGELSRMRDTDGDDRMDVMETIADPWEISGNYHEYAFGPALGLDGAFYVTLNKPFGDEPFGRADWRGFALRIESDGTWAPIACGLRSPAGVGTSPWGDVFYTDNQGEWCGASKLSLLRDGSCHGHPWGLFSCERDEWTHGDPGEMPNGVLMPLVPETVPSFELPAVWFPYDKTGRSPAGFAWDRSDGAFGPFAGQLFVGDQYQASLNRVFLERVNGHVQGAVFPFLKGLASGVTRVEFAPDGSLLIGMTDRGWTALGTRTFGLQRVVWTGATPFEIAEMRARPDGFELELTADVDPEAAGDPASYALSSYTYELHASYGSDEMDVRQLVVRDAKVAANRRTVRLFVDGLREGYVHELHADGLRAGDGRSLAHADAYYTLIELPESLEPSGAAPTREVHELDDEGRTLRDGVERQAPDGAWSQVGPWREGGRVDDYYGDGQFQVASGDYVAGEREGLWTAVDESGDVVRRGRYAAGVEEGPWTWFHDNGERMIAGTFASGVQVGKWSWWYDDGRLYKSGVFDELGRDQGTWRFFHADGTLWREGAYADGAPVGVWREWHDNGQLASEGELVPEPEPEGDWFTLDDDGVKSSVRAGTWREWWPNGRLRAEGEWQDGFPVEPHRWWHEDGTPSERRIGG